MKKWVAACVILLSVAAAATGIFLTSTTNAQTAPLRAPGEFRATAAGPTGVLLTWNPQPGYAGVELWRWDVVSGSVYLGYYSPATSSWGTLDLATGTHWFYAAGWDGTRYSEWVSASISVADASPSPAATSSQGTSGPTRFTATAAGPAGVLLTWLNDRSYEGLELWSWDNLNGSAFVGYYWPNTTSWGTLNLSPGAHWFYVAGWDGTKYSDWASASITISSNSSVAPSVAPTSTRTPAPTPTPSPAASSGSASQGPACCGAPGVVGTPTPAPTPAVTAAAGVSKSPLAPASFTATVENGTSVRLAWRDTSLNETGFDVWSWSEVDGWFHVATVPSNVTGASDDGLTPGATYYFRVAAFNASGQSPWATTTVSVPRISLAGPSGLKLESVSSALRISWNSDARATGYELTRWSETEGSKRIAFLLSGTTSYLDKDVTTRRTYSYYLASFNGTAYSQWLSVSGELKQTPPGPPPRPTVAPPPSGPPLGTTPVPTATPRPTAVAVPTPTPNPARIRVIFNTADGVQLTGYYWGRGRTTAIILSHSYAENQQTWRQFAEYLINNGHSVLTFDFRGYGESSGARSVPKTEQDLEGAIAYLRANEGVRNVYLIGASMGGTASLRLAQRISVIGVISVSSPINFEGLQPGDVSRITAPKLFLAGNEDYDFAAFAQNMYDQSVPPKDIQIYESSAHGEFLAMGEAKTRILEFLRRYPPTALNMMAQTTKVVSDAVSIGAAADSNMKARLAKPYEYLAASSFGTQITASYAIDLPAPSGASASVENGDQVRLTWKDNAPQEAGYVISRWDDQKGRRIWRLPANSTAFSDRKSIAGKTYTYEIAAVDADGSHSTSASVTFTVPIVPLSPPTSFRAEAVMEEGLPSVALSWRHRPSDDYSIEIQRQRDDEARPTYLTVVDGTERSFVDAEVLPQHTYTYTIFTTDGLRYSEPVQATAEIGIRLRQIDPVYTASIGGAECGFLQRANGTVQLRVVARGDAVAPIGKGVALFFRPKGDIAEQSAFELTQVQWMKGLKEITTVPGRATFSYMLHDAGPDSTLWGASFDRDVTLSGDGKAPTNFFVDIFVAKFDMDSFSSSTSGGGLLQSARIPCSVTIEDQGSPSIAPPTPPRQEPTSTPAPRSTATPLAFRIGALPDAEEDVEYRPNGQPYSFCDPPTTTFTTQCPPPGQVGRNPSGGNPPYHFQYGTAGGFPPIGMALGKDGQLTGKPARGTGGRTYRFVVCAIDLSADSVCHEVSIYVKAAPTPTPTPTPTRTAIPTPTRTPTPMVSVGDGSIPVVTIQSFTCTRTLIQNFQSGGSQYEFTATASGTASGPVYANAQVTISTQYVRIVSVNRKSSASWTGTYYSGGPIERAAGDPASTTWNAQLVWRGTMYPGDTEGVTLRVSIRERNYDSVRLPDRRLNCQ